MSTYEHDIDAANARIEELEAENQALVSAAQAVQKALDTTRAENLALKAGKTQGAVAAAKVAQNLADFQNAAL